MAWEIPKERAVYFSVYPTGKFVDPTRLIGGHVRGPSLANFFRDKVIRDAAHEEARTKSPALPGWLEI